MTSTLPAAQLALARGRAYSLFGRLFLQGLQPGDAAAIETIPDLASGATGLTAADQEELDRLAADHYALFGLNVFPFESVFLDAEGNLGGLVTEEVVGFYRQVGFDVLQAGENPDHVGHELGMLASLSMAESEAWEDGLAPVARRLQDLQRRFLDGHLLRWLPGLVQAIRQQGETFYAILADLTLELAGEHRSGLADGKAIAQPRFELPPAPDVLANEKSGLKEIARNLLTPVSSGLYLSREDISRLASDLGIPRGFGSREQMLTNLFRSAADYEQIPTLVDSLLSITDVWVEFYRTLSEVQRSLEPFAAPWLERLSETRTLLSRLSAQVK